MIRFMKACLICVAGLFPVAVAAQMTVPAARAATDFDTWRNGFRETALAAGISSKVFDTAFRSVRVTPRTRTNDANQPEFVRSIWEYLDDAVSSSRISTGRAKANQLGSLLRSIERKYGVDSEALLAIWGMETNFGSFRGTTYTIEALANTAFDGRRRAFAEKELLAALEILARGDVTSAKMIGGWSGAMGHTQFMPSTYLRYGVDQNGDGKRDIWANDPADALASAANYLKRLGWKNNAPWGVEVTLPEGFDYALIGEYDTRSAGFWNTRGVRLTDGRKVPAHGATALIAPAGANGPIFAVFPNFQVIRQYNMSVSYALSVGHLSDRIVGSQQLQTSWPRNATPLSRAEQQEIQALLHKRGFDVGVIDGMLGPKSIEAIQTYQISIGALADGYATINLLKLLRR